MHIQSYLVSRIFLQYNVFVNTPAGEISAVDVPSGSTVNYNWWGDENPSSGNDQLVEWKFLPWESNVHHSDSSPLRMDLTFDKNSYVFNETVTATLSFYNPDGSLFTGNIFDAKYDNQYLSFSVSPDISTKNVYYNRNNVVMKLIAPQKEDTFKVTFTISSYPKQISLSKTFPVINLSISVPEIEDYCGNGQSLKIYLRGNENIIANQKVTVSFLRSTFETYTDENGYASVFLDNLPITPGRYSISVTARDLTVESTVTVLSTINANDIVRVLGDYTPFYASFVDRMGQPLAAGTFVGYDFENTPLLYMPVGNDGLASFSIGFLGVGEHTIGLYNFETYEAAVYKITILESLVGCSLKNENYQENSSIAQNDYVNIVGDLPLDNYYFNVQSNNSFVESDVNNRYDDSAVRSVVNNQSDANVYIALVLILLILTSGVLIKKFKD